MHASNSTGIDCSNCFVCLQYQRLQALVHLHTSHRNEHDLVCSLRILTLLMLLFCSNTYSNSSKAGRPTLTLVVTVKHHCSCLLPSKHTRFIHMYYIHTTHSNKYRRSLWLRVLDTHTLSCAETIDFVYILCAFWRDWLLQVVPLFSYQHADCAYTLQYAHS